MLLTGGIHFLLSHLLTSHTISLLLGDKLSITKDDRTVGLIAARVDGGEDFINRLSGYSDSQALIDAINALRPSMSNWRITTYEHKPLMGVSAITTPDGTTTYYDYDELGRLCRTYVIHDGRTETIRQYDYHYKTE